MIKDFNQLSSSELEIHENKWGKFNDLPPGWREITQKEFAQSNFFCYQPDMMEYRQMWDRSTPAVRTFFGNLFFMWDGTGYSIINDYWKGEVRFFSFGCSHEYGPDPDFIPKFLTEHGSKCVKCGHRLVVDSSD